MLLLVLLVLERGLAGQGLFLSGVSKEGNEERGRGWLAPLALAGRAPLLSFGESA
jgi:hypothetical protein